ncbi:MAG: O-antigen ligase family protein [Chloroflexi bacterium]|nr:O-antigen ligase family protein [Chloroflexota bacterium]
MISWEDMIHLGDLTLARVTGLLVAGFWILTVMVTGRFRKPHPFHIAIVLFVLWNVVSVFWSVDIDRTVARLLTYFQLVGLVLILWDLYTSSAAVKAGLQAYVLGAYVAAGSTIANYLLGNALFAGRYAATGFNVNSVGLTLALGIPVAWHLAVSKPESTVIQRLLTLANYIYLPVAVTAILLTASRGSLIAAMPAILFVVVSLPRFKLYQRVLILAALIGALFALTPLVPQRSLERLATAGSSIAEADLGGRVNIWREGIAVFADHPLIGIGSGAFSFAVDSGMSSHNSYLNVMVEVGMIGFVLLAIIVGITVYQAIRHPKWDARFWLTLLLVLALGNLVHGWVDRKATWLFLSLVVVSANLSIRQIQSRLPSEYPAKLFRSSNLSDVRRNGQPTQDFHEPGESKPRLAEAK